jgi:heptosyltransferase-2
MQLRNLNIKIAIYSPNWIGDAVMALPFIQLLKEKNPQAELNIVCKDWVSAVFKNNRSVNQIIPIPQDSINSFSGTVRIGLKLRSEKFDLFYTLTDSIRSAIILWLSGARVRVGYDTQMRSFFLTDYKILPLQSIHRSYKYLSLIEPGVLTQNIPEISLSTFEEDWAKKEMRKLGLNSPIALAPFSVANNRTLQNNILDKWIKNTKNSYLIFGSYNDIEKSNNLIKFCKSDKIKSICGKYSLRQSIALIYFCKYTLATDSGLGHLSAALGTPTISFFGVGNIAVTAPIGKKNSIIKHCTTCLGDFCEKNGQGTSCIKKISKENIENAVNKIIDQ